jgi:hypothetical protein
MRAYGHQIKFKTNLQSALEQRQAEIGISKSQLHLCSCIPDSTLSIADCQAPTTLRSLLRSASSSRFPLAPRFAKHA